MESLHMHLLNHNAMVLSGACKSPQLSEAQAHLDPWWTFLSEHLYIRLLPEMKHEDLVQGDSFSTLLEALGKHSCTDSLRVQLRPQF